MRVGAATGHVTATCVGHARSLKFTTTGDVVRSAAQLLRDLEAWRAAGVAYVRDQLTRALELMGIDVPGRM